MSGKIVLITDGSSGIGAATAVAEAEAGAPVHPGTELLDLDFTNTDALQAATIAAEGLTVLVNCAGISRNRDEYQLGRIGESACGHGSLRTRACVGWINTPLGEGLKADKIASGRIPGRTPRRIGGGRKKLPAWHCFSAVRRRALSPGPPSLA
jgi:hypothetical protein